ncbi:MAG TPA: hypothetical protein VN903_33045 [Polyangia bacterium]|nr:hypothetical protein [Polyangia bacterium]
MTDHTVSRSLGSLIAILTLATGIALTAAPSTAHAETTRQIVTSDGTIDCPPCRFFKLADQRGLSFGDVTAEVQNGDQLVITADVTAAGTAGKPRTGSVVISAFMNYDADGRFMDYTDDACTPSLASRQAGDQACDAVSRALRDAANAATAPTAPIVAPAAPTEGIIMRDGGVCDPIRHMGC